MTDNTKDALNSATKDESKPIVEETDPAPAKVADAPAVAEPAAKEAETDGSGDKAEVKPTETREDAVETVSAKPDEATEEPPVETQQAEPGPAEATPAVEIKTTETKTVAVRDGETVTTETTTVEIKPVEAKVIEEATPAEPAPVVPEAIEVSESKPVAESKPSGVEPAKAEPAKEESIQEGVVEDVVQREPEKAEPTKEVSQEEAVQEEATQEVAAREEVVQEEAVQEVVQEEAVKVDPEASKPAEVAEKPIAARPVEIEEFSDPDEDDLDDLDDMLDDFSTVNLQSQKSLAPPSAPNSEAPKDAPPGKQPELDEMFSEEEFAKQLQAGMADLLGEMEKSPDVQAQFEDIFKQIAASEGTADPAAPSGSANPAPAPNVEDASFQDTIRRTMERMQASGEQATAAAASGGADDFMSEMLKQLSSGDLGALGGEENEEEFSKMLMGMMEQLTNKEILYEPMKELDEKFPAWLAKNGSTTPKEDLKRYEEQRTVVREIVAKFEEKTYSDSNAADREFIVDRMQKMQAAGSPPADLVGDIPSAQDALNPGDESCNPQ